MNAGVISIVDDDEYFCRGISAFVRSLGHRVAVYRSAEEFLESGAIATSACLISDVQMPGMSGLDLQRRILAGGHPLPIIFVAVDPESRARGQALTAGALAFLNKPFDEDKLISCIDQALARR